MNDIPRRCFADRLTPVEKQAHDLVGTIEALGGHPLLTEAQTKVMDAKRILADWIDAGAPGGSPSGVMEG